MDIVMFGILAVMIAVLAAAAYLLGVPALVCAVVGILLVGFAGYKTLGVPRL